MVRYILCLVCGRMTPTDRGVCYHCGSPLPTEMHLPLGLIVCPNCLKITPVDTGYCSHCRALLPPDLVKAAKRELAKYRLKHDQNTYVPREKYIYDITTHYKILELDNAIDDIRRRDISPNNQDYVRELPSPNINNVRILRVRKLHV